MSGKTNGPQSKMKYSMSIPAQVSAISPLLDEVMARIRENYARPIKIDFAIETTLREAFRNAFSYGCKGDA